MSVIFLASILMVPFGAIHDKNHSIFGLNASAWSLFWEDVANIAFAVVLYRLRRNALIVFTVVMAALLCWSSQRAGNIYGGWSTRSFWDGGVRVAFSFSAGLLLYRMRWRPRSPFGFLSLSALLLIAFITPFADGGWRREDAGDHHWLSVARRPGCWFHRYGRESKSSAAWQERSLTRST